MRRKELRIGLVRPHTHGKGMSRERESFGEEEDGE